MFGFIKLVLAGLALFALIASWLPAREPDCLVCGTYTSVSTSFTIKKDDPKVFARSDGGSTMHHDRSYGHSFMLAPGFTADSFRLTTTVTDRLREHGDAPDLPVGTKVTVSFERVREGSPEQWLATIAKAEDGKPFYSGLISSSNYERKVR